MVDCNDSSTYNSEIDVPEWLIEPQRYQPKTFEQWRKENNIKKVFAKMLKSGYMAKITIK